MNYTDLELARMQAEALYVHDANGRLLCSNEPDPDQPAPRFFLARTVAGNLWRTRYDLPTALTTDLEQLASDEPVVHDRRELHEPPRYMQKYRELLERYAPIEKTYIGPAYYLPDLDPPTDTVTITPENATLLQTYFPYTLTRLAERAPIVVITIEGMAVAACYSARITAQVAEAGVNTEEAYRGRGYADQTVRGWAAAIRATNRLPLYSTWWDNTASQAVAAKLGAVFYAVDFSLT